MQPQRRTIKQIFLIAIAVIAGFVVFCELKETQAAINKEINYQGKLTDTSDQAVTDGNYNMTFRLYTTATSATTTNIWEEELTGNDAVSVSNGLFSYMLGSSTALTSVDFNQTLYLGVEIGATGTPAWDGEMTPRKRLGAVPAAFEADQLDGIDSTSFLRSDDADTMASTSASTLLTVQQDGTGNIVDFKDGSNTVLLIANGGNITFGNSGMLFDYASGFLGIGTSSPYAMLSVAGETVSQYFTATSTSATSTMPYLDVTRLNINSEFFTDLTGTGLINTSGALTVDDISFLSLTNYFSSTTPEHITSLPSSSYITGLAQLGQIGDVSTTSLATWDILYYDGNNWVRTATSSWNTDTDTNYWTDGGATTYLTATTDHVAVGTSSAAAMLTVWGAGTTGAEVFTVVDNASSTILTVLDSGRIAIATTSPAYTLDIGGDLHTFGTLYASTSARALDILNTTDAASNQVGIFRANERVTAADNDQGYLSFYGDDDNSDSAEFARMTWNMTDVTNNTKDAEIIFYGMKDNALTEMITINPSTGQALDVNGIAIADNITANEALTVTGGDAWNSANYALRGASSGHAKLILGNGDASTTGGNSMASQIILGRWSEAGSGNHPLIANIAVGIPTIDAGGATVSDTATVYIEGAMSATVTGQNYGLWVDAGTSRFDGDVAIGTTTPHSSLTVWGSGNLFELVDTASTTLFVVNDDGDLTMTGTTTMGALIYPNYDGSVNQILYTDGSGNLLWTATSSWASLGSYALNDLSDVNVAAALGNMIYYDGSQWSEIATSALAINLDNIIDGSSYVRLSATKDSYIDQDVTSASSPNFSNASMTGNISVWTNNSGYITSGSIAQLGQIGDVSTTSLATWDILYYDGSNWVPTATSTWASMGSYALNDLTDVNVAAALGNMIYYDGSQWSEIATSALAINLDNIVDGSSYVRLTTTKNSYIDQDVTSASSPNFSNASMTGNISVWTNNSGYITSGSIAQLGQIGDVSTTSLATWDILYYDGSNWVPTATSTWDTGWTALSDMILATGNIYVGDGSNDPAATSSIYIHTNQYVGIGTTTPNWNLQIVDTRPFLTLSDTSAGTDDKHWFMSSQGGNFYIGTSTDALSATSTYLTIDSTGNVKIANALTLPSGTDPTIDVTGEIFIDTNADNDLVDQGIITYYDGSQQMYVMGIDAISGWSDNDVMTYDAGSDKWVVEAQSGGSGLWTDGGATSYLTATTDHVAVGTSSASAWLTVWSSGSSGLETFSVVDSASSTVFTVFDDAKVGIGTSSPANLLSIDGGAGSTNGLTIENLGTATRGIDLSNSGLAGTDYLIYIGANDYWRADNMLRINTIYAGAGTAVTPSYAFNADTNVGIFKPDIDNLGFTTDGNERMRIDSSGNVGIGTTSPYAKLSVVGDIVMESFYATSTTATSTIDGDLWVKDYLQIGTGSSYLTDSSTSTMSYGIDIANGCFAINGVCVTGGGSGSGTVNSGTAGYLAFYPSTDTTVDDTDALFFDDSTDRLGIGTTTPNSLFHIAGATPKLTLSDTGAGSNLQHWFIQSNAGDLRFATTSDSLVDTNVAALTISSAGYLGIGTSTPQVALHIGTASTTHISSMNDSVFISGELEVAENAYFGPMAFQDDSGMVSWIDLAVTSSSTADTVNGYSARVDGTDIFTIYTVADGSGSIKEDYRIGIATTSPMHPGMTIVASSSIANSYLFTIWNATSTPDELRFMVDAEGDIAYDGGASAGGADYAEYFYTKDTDLASGEIVCVDITRNNAVKRCQRGADGNVMGIVSTHPAIIGNAKPGYKDNPNYKVIGMLGQVLAKISTENGPIRPGDSLTSASSTPGYAMRASAGDPTVGVALEAFNPPPTPSQEGQPTPNPSQEGTGVINVLISRRNKSLTVEQVEEQITQRVANMEIEDEVNLLVANAVDNLDLTEQVGEIVDEQILLLDAKLTVEVDNLTGQLANINENLSELNANLVNLQQDMVDLDTRLSMLEQGVSASSSRQSLIITPDGHIKMGNNIHTPNPSHEGNEDVAIVEIGADSDKTALVINQAGDGDVADFQAEGVSVVNIADTGKVTIVGEMLVDGRIMVCSGGACGNILDEAVDETMGDIGIEGKVVAGAFEGYCEEGFIWVPGSAKYGTLPGFCVMERKARIRDGQPTPNPSQEGKVWTGVSQGEAQIACQSLGMDYHLIGENEWLTIAENIIRVRENDIDLLTDGLQLATPEKASSTAIAYLLTNDYQIYDLVSEVSEWIDQVVTQAGVMQPRSDEWQEYFEIEDYKGLNIAPAYYYSSANGIGRIRTGDNNKALRGFVRGFDGIYSLDLSYAPDEVSEDIGFRCAK